MSVDSFKFLPRLIGLVYEMTDQQPEYPIPWTPLAKPISDCKFALITSGGLYHKGVQPPFDIEREKKDPTWGDPSFRVIPSDIPQHEVGVSHLHVNPDPVMKDINVLLPFDRFYKFAEEGRIGDLAEDGYSFMGYQGYPPDPSAWKEDFAPQVIEKLKTEQVDCVLLTPS
jgi:D-proline reductase (dithiol) PrdB